MTLLIVAAAVAFVVVLAALVLGLVSAASQLPRDPFE